MSWYTCQDVRTKLSVLAGSFMYIGHYIIISYISFICSWGVKLVEISSCVCSCDVELVKMHLCVSADQLSVINIYSWLHIQFFSS
jgi:hypothetical protein